ncbi:MAG: EAL domain-containing protein, partial [Bilophila sp.]
DNEAACLMVLSEHFVTDKEQEQRNKRETIALALSMSHDTVIDIDPATGRYEFLSALPQERVPRAGDYETEIPKMYQGFAAPAYLDLVLKTFSLAHMQEVFASGIPEVSLDFQCMTDTGYIWKHRRAVPYTLTDGSRHIIGYSHDITPQKQAEQHRIQTEQAYRLALQASYAEIYEVDPYANSIVCIQNNTEPRVVVPLSGLFREDVQALARADIPPEHQEQYLAHYNNAAIAALLSANTEAGRTNVLEYRSKAGTNDYRWLLSRILPLLSEAHQETGATKALILIRDIMAAKQQEERQRLATQYDRALRNIFEEVYLLNVTRDTYRMLYHTENRYVTLPETGSLSETLHAVAQKGIHPEDKVRFCQFFAPDTVRAEFAAGREFRLGEFRKLGKDGSYYWAALTMFPMPPSENSDEAYLLFILDISERKQAEEIAQQNALLERQSIADERYKIIVEQTDTLVFEWYKKNNNRYYCPQIPLRFIGNYQTNRDIKSIWIEDNVVYKDDVHLVHEFFQILDNGESHAEMRCRLHRIDGQYIWCKISMSVLRDTEGEITRVIGTINDVDEAMRSMNTLKFQAKYDMLTNILNAQAFYTAAANMVDSSQDKTWRIVRMDIERFKIVNDLYGLKEGDRLLRAVAGIISSKVANHGICGRISGDIFCMCVDFSDEQILERIWEIEAKLSYYPLPYKIAPAFGICAVDNANTPISVLCDWANIALKTIKGNSLKSYAFYNDTLRSKIFQEKKIENEMYSALNSGQFVMFLQPKVSIASSRIIGAEALARWEHPTEGLIVPDVFVPLFEKNGFIVRLDEYIWEQACIAIRSWRDKGYRMGAVSVNISRMHFHEARFWKKLVALVEKYQIPPRLLELELTETVFLENATQLGEAMQALQDYGFHLSMDDFGSGYSSLTMLKNLPLNIIKIDRSFLQEGVSTAQGQIIIRHILSMAKQLRLQTIAEGVETLEQARFLLDSGCTTAQGYYYSRPVPLKSFEQQAFPVPLKSF